jgi:hypothetical protein
MPNPEPAPQHKMMQLISNFKNISKPLYMHAVTHDNESPDDHARFETVYEDYRKYCL